MGSFSINTNITSLQAQNYLRVDANFQNKTINQVTSGLRIVNSGDDAAGLAIANTDRSNEAVLTQGITAPRQRPHACHRIGIRHIHRRSQRA